MLQQLCCANLDYVFQTLYDSVELVSRQRVESLMNEVGGVNHVVGTALILPFSELIHV